MTETYAIVSTATSTGKSTLAAIAWATHNWTGTESQSDPTARVMARYRRARATMGLGTLNYFYGDEVPLNANRIILDVPGDTEKEVLHALSRATRIYVPVVPSEEKSIIGAKATLLSFAKSGATDRVVLVANKVTEQSEMLTIARLANDYGCMFYPAPIKLLPQSTMDDIMHRGLTFEESATEDIIGMDKAVRKLVIENHKAISGMFDETSYLGGI